MVAAAELPPPRRRTTPAEVAWGLAPLLLILGAWWIVTALGHLESAQTRIGYGNRAVGCANALAGGYTLEQLPTCREPKVLALFDAKARPATLGDVGRASRLPSCALLRAEHPELMAELERTEGRTCEAAPLAPSSRP